MTAPTEITQEQVMAAIRELGFAALDDHVSEIHIDFADTGLGQVQVTTHEFNPLREVRYGYRLKRKSADDLAHQVVTGRST